MIHRNLHLVAERLLREAQLLDANGRLHRFPANVEHIAEQTLRYSIVGSSSKGQMKLPPRRNGEIRVAEQIILVRSSLLDDEQKIVQYNEIVSHEVAHAALHQQVMSQIELPLGSSDREALKAKRLSFSTSQSSQCEREAIYLGALLQIPFIDLKETIMPAIAAYAFGKHSLMTSCIRESEAQAAKRYQSKVVQLVEKKFEVTQRTAKIALDYWQVYERPPSTWIKEVREALQRASD